MQVRRDEGRGVHQAKAGHAQHAVDVMAGVVAAQVFPDRRLVGGFLFGIRLEAGVDVFAHSAGAAWSVKPVARRQISAITAIESTMVLFSVFALVSLFRLVCV